MSERMEPPFTSVPDRPDPVGPTDAARNPPTSVGSVGVPGRGTEPPFIPCRKCKGTGRIMGLDIDRPCPKCNGTGRRDEPPFIENARGILDEADRRDRAELFDAPPPPCMYPDCRKPGRFILGHGQVWYRWCIDHVEPHGWYQLHALIEAVRDIIRDHPDQS